MVANGPQAPPWWTSCPRCGSDRVAIAEEADTGEALRALIRGESSVMPATCEDCGAPLTLTLEAVARAESAPGGKVVAMRFHASERQ
jgi:hypothetical protein